ncbi:hypothetical protein [Nibricoccus sp. IMCC34717]|uniref:hypothetical protein n=1 Tax=Nibricoccus sp. IMCC34717 TaxID=3034021 RepID=UPI00384AE8DB
MKVIRLFLALLGLTLLARAQAPLPAAQTPFPQIIYWKWDDTIFKPGTLDAKLDDLMARSGFDTLCVSFHWMEAGYFDPRLQAAIKRTALRLKENGRRMILDIDVRTEGDEYVKEFPGERSGFVGMAELTLDAEGRGETVVKTEQVHRFGRKRTVRPESVAAAWAFTPTGELDFKPETLAVIDSQVTCEADASGGTRLRVAAGRENAGKRALLFPRFTHVTPDLFSPNLHTYVEKMFESVAALPLYGTAVDEWGISFIFHFDAQGLYFEELAYSDYMDRAYESRHGRRLRDDLLLLRYGPRGERVRVINQYLANLRAGMAANEKMSYDFAKRFFGKDAFVGTHPTWSADSLEVFQNGLSWWEVKRDYGQTDENVIVPIRLALAHKAGGAVWYNMYYSMDLATVAGFYKETWANARWGGRTHNLGYECPNEQVCEYAKPGNLEAIWEMEAQITKLNQFQRSAPDSRVLVLFGMEAATNWAFTEKQAAPFRGLFPNYRQALETAQGIFDGGYLCDLVPTSELTNGSLALVDGRPRYGTQTYDAVVLVAPEAMPATVHAQLAAMAKTVPLLVVGDATLLADGSAAGAVFGQVTAPAAAHLPADTSVAALVERLKALKITGNRFPNGCVLQDGSLVFAAEGTMASGNPLRVDVVHQGHRIQFEGSDFLAIKLTPDGKVERWAAGAKKSLAINNHTLP